ncbi:hypothetical protein ES703_54148 [subsurface metagenome]
MEEVEEKVHQGVVVEVLTPAVAQKVALVVVKAAVKGKEQAERDKLKGEVLC